MAMSKKQERNLLIGAVALVAAGWGLYAVTRRPSQPEDAYQPGDDARVVQGQQILLRLPRGQYEMVGDDGLVTVMAQRHKGEATDISLQIGADVSSYELDLLFVDETDTENTFPLHIEALLPKDF